MGTKLQNLHRIGEILDYRNGTKDVQAEIFEIEISITRHATNIIYHVVNEIGDNHQVDGDTFKKI